MTTPTIESIVEGYHGFLRRNAQLAESGKEIEALDATTNWLRTTLKQLVESLIEREVKSKRYETGKKSEPEAIYYEIAWNKKAEDTVQALKRLL